MSKITEHIIIIYRAESIFVITASGRICELYLNEDNGERYIYYGAFIHQSIDRITTNDEFFEFLTNSERFIEYIPNKDLKIKANTSNDFFSPNWLKQLLNCNPLSPWIHPIANAETSNIASKLKHLMRHCFQDEGSITVIHQGPSQELIHCPDCDNFFIRNTRGDQPIIQDLRFMELALWELVLNNPSCDFALEAKLFPHAEILLGNGYNLQL